MMKLSRIYLLIGIIAVSIVFLFRVDLGGFNSDAGRIAVITRYYGVTAEEIEQIITIPLEQSFSSIAGIDELNAYSEYSLSRIDMKLHASADNDEVVTQIRETTDRIYGRISTGHQAVQKPQIVTSGGNQQAIFSAAVSHPEMTAVELRPVVENRIKTEYSKIAGLGEIDITGGVMHEIHVCLDTDKAAAYGYGPRAIASVIRSSNIYTPCGNLDDGIFRIPVSFDARINEIEDLQNLPAAPNIKLDDIADISYSFREQDNINRCNGSETVGLYIKSSAPDLIGISKQLREITKKLMESGYSIEVINDRGSELERSFKRIILAIGLGIIISSLLLFTLGMDIRRLFFLSFSQPIIIITAAGSAAAVGFIPDSFLLAGFAIGLGMILDSSILITGALKEGFESYKKILKPLISSTLSTLIALLPIIALRAELPGFVSLVAALAIILIVSLFLSASFLPSLYIPKLPVKKKLISSLAAVRRNVLRTAFRFVSIKRSLLLYALVVAAGIISLMGLQIRINSPVETSILFVQLELNTGESLASVDEKMLMITEAVSGIKGVSAIQSNSRRGGGTIVVKFNEKETDSNSLTEQIKAAGRQYGGFLHFPNNFSGVKTMIQISVTGDDTAVLRKISRKALQSLIKQPWAMEGILHFKEDSPAYHFITDSESLYDAGITTADAASFLRWNLQGPVAAKWQSAGAERDLRVMSKNNAHFISADITAMKIPLSDESSPVRLDQLGKIIRAEESLRINRLNMQHAESFTVICKKDDPVKLNEQIWSELENINLPEGYAFSPSTKLIQKQVFYRRLWIQFAIALILIFFMLCIERESFKQPLIIIMLLPPILAVPIIFLKIIGADLGSETIIGLTLLAGMGINNGILVMNNIDSGFKIAVKVRFNGLFLTTITSVAGMIPLLFTGSTFFMNIALVLMSGLSASFLAAILILPAQIMIAPTCKWFYS